MALQVKVFGSFATGLYLPTSDVDVSSLAYVELIFLNVEALKCYMTLTSE